MVYFDQTLQTYNLSLSRHWYTKRRQGFAEHQFGHSWSVSEIAHNASITWYIFIKFCLLIHFKIVFYK